MAMTFYKYQGTGNDFIIIDNRTLFFDTSDNKNIAKLCDRRFGIGADGLILLENHSTADFKMVYFNADGNESSMCGNGGRCIVAFANYLGIIKDKATFEAIDGMHHAKINGTTVKLQMQDVAAVERYTQHVFLDTGSPHHIEVVENLQNYDVTANGAKIRYGKPYNAAGSNVNFVNQLSDNTFAVRTYERGVEDETLSCGTGVTAVAIAMHNAGHTNANEVTLQTQGGELQVVFDTDNKQHYHNIWLIGPANQVFKGEL